MHVEEARIHDIGVVHSVMYPRDGYDVPILALDLVSIRSMPTFAILDACPVTDDLSLPDDYARAFAQACNVHGASPVGRESMPDWGAAIFSDECVMLRGDALGAVDFVELATSVAAVHYAWSLGLAPSSDTARIRRNQARFSEHQRRNERTRGVLRAVLGAQWAEEYMRTVMFD
jgi:phycocyanobilin:ferredoxin oxidoreductase